jgi:hypothetical protein
MLGGWHDHLILQHAPHLISRDMNSPWPLCSLKIQEKEKGGSIMILMIFLRTTEIDILGSVLVEI